VFAVCKGKRAKRRIPFRHYTPEVSTKTTIINFAVKQQGLESQLLGIVVQKEQPALERQKSDLTLRVAAGKKKLVDLEDEILRLLSETEGSLLDNESLVDTLQQSKVTSDEVSRQLKEAEETEVRIDAKREEFRPAAIRSSIAYFVLDDMSRVDPMYQFSLDAYENKKKSSKGLYSCPLYMYPLRTGSRERPSFVISCDVKSGVQTSDYWTLSSASHETRYIFEREFRIVCICLFQVSGNCDASLHNLLSTWNRIILLDGFATTLLIVAIAAPCSRALRLQSTARAPWGTNKKLECNIAHTEGSSGNSGAPYY